MHIWKTYYQVQESPIRALPITETTLLASPSQINTYKIEVLNKLGPGAGASCAKLSS